MTENFLSSLQERGFAGINQEIFSNETQEYALAWAQKKIVMTNQYSQSIVSNDKEIFFPAEMNYSGIRIISRSLGMPMPKKTIIYRRMDSPINGLFVDIINPDAQLKCLQRDLHSSEFFKLLAKVYQYRQSSIEFHIYYTKSCANPRTWHIDGPTLKIFTYLTDVKNEHGPYAYQLNSHRHYDREIANTKESQPLKSLKSNVSKKYFEPKNIINTLGPKGTSFISNQSGIHRGLSQSIGLERYVLVVQLS